MTTFSLILSSTSCIFIKFHWGGGDIPPSRSSKRSSTECVQAIWRFGPGPLSKADLWDQSSKLIRTAFLLGLTSLWSALSCVMSHRTPQWTLLVLTTLHAIEMCWVFHSAVIVDFHFILCDFCFSGFCWHSMFFGYRFLLVAMCYGLCRWRTVWSIGIIYILDSSMPGMCQCTILSLAMHW